MTIAKIISGGQTGVDRGALEASLKLGFPYGGMIPNGRKAATDALPQIRAFLKMEGGRL